MVQRIHRVASGGKKLAFLSVLILATILGYQRLTAHSIDYIGMSFSPLASMVGGSGNWTVTNLSRAAAVLLSV
jgi:hypothetical protein